MNLPRFQIVPAPETALVDEWDADQLQVLAHAGDPALVLGGPGTGKTTVLTEQVARQCGYGVPLGDMLVLTSSRSAAKRLRTDIVRRLQGAHLAPRVTTVYGFCAWLIGRFADSLMWSSPRLLRAPEQEFRLREILAEHDTSSWPPEVSAASTTRAFASQIRAVLARARQLGLDPEELRRFGTVDPIWECVGGFLDEYLTVLDFEGTLDYAELVHRCRLLLTVDEVRASVAADLVAVYCDEFAELDASQLGLIGDLVGLGIGFTGYADPQQVIYQFRGATDDPVAAFRTRFPQTTTYQLRTNHRASKVLVAACRGLARKINAAGSPPPAEAAANGGVVRAAVYDDPAAEISHLVEQLRSAHLKDGVPWRDCAVITRKARSELIPLARTLRQHSIPVEVAGDEIALGEQLAVRPLLLALEACLDAAIDEDQATRLLISPLGGLDAMRLRRLARRLRFTSREPGEPTRPTPGLIAEILMDPATLPAEDPDADHVRRLAALLHGCREAIGHDQTVHQLLWELWQATDWPDRLWRAAVYDGDLQANADLDAICELFYLAARSDQFTGRRGVQVFLSEVRGQLIPADTERESDPRGRGVSLLTAHRAKGRQFRRVFVIGANEGNWPVLTRTSSLLDPELLDQDGVAQFHPGSQLGNERRLFYVACTRASEYLIVSGVRSSSAGEEMRPSRFLRELGVPVGRVTGLGRSPLTLAGLVAELRRVCCDPGAEPGLREAAAQRLARLADFKDHRGRSLAPGADPDQWWGTLPQTSTTLPELKPRFTGSEIADLLECPRRWFLSRRVRADQHQNASASLGSIMHLLAQHALSSKLSAAELHDHLDDIWERIPFETAWLSAAERAGAEAALERIYAWQRGNDDREVLGVEVGFEVQVALGDDEIVLAGSVDRLELDADNRLRIIDFKTSRQMPSRKDVHAHEQLGVYQLAARYGAFEAQAPGIRQVADAQLVLVRGQQGDSPWPKVFTQPSLDEVPHLSEEDHGYPTWVHRKLTEARQITLAKDYRALRCQACRYCQFRRGCPALAGTKDVVS